MNTIPHHHRWPAEGSAQRHWHEKLVEGHSFGGGAGQLSSISASILVSRKMCVCCKCMRVSAKEGAVVLESLTLIRLECN